MGKALSSPLAPVVFFAIGAAACSMTYPLMGLNWSDRYQLIVSYGWMLMLLSWLCHDAQRNGWTPCFDLGLLTTLTFPTSILWYGVWSRRARGLLVVLFLVFLYFASWVPAVAVMVTQQMLP